MTMGEPERIVYVTSSDYKRAENAEFMMAAKLGDGTSVGEAFRFDIRPVRIAEELEIRLSDMVRAEVAQAYRQLHVPCIVEHAGLVFSEYVGREEQEQFPGGLTKPMWDALGDRFLEETRGAGRRAIARAVVAYCDGQRIETFRGETPGQLAEEPRGSREFYWDTVFIPDNEDGEPGEETYAEIVDDATRGLAYKVQNLSQSTKAMLSFLEWKRTAAPAFLWPDGL